MNTCLDICAVNVPSSFPVPAMVRKYPMHPIHDPAFRWDHYPIDFEIAHHKCWDMRREIHHLVAHLRHKTTRDA